MTSGSETMTDLPMEPVWRIVGMIAIDGKDLEDESPVLVAELVEVL